MYGKYRYFPGHLPEGLRISFYWRFLGVFPGLSPPGGSSPCRIYSKGFREGFPSGVSAILLEYLPLHIRRDKTGGESQTYLKLQESILFLLLGVPIPLPERSDLSPVVGLSVFRFHLPPGGVIISICVSFPLLSVEDSVGLKDGGSYEFPEIREEVEPGTESLSLGGVGVFDIVPISPRFQVTLPPDKIVPGGDIIPYLPGLELSCEGVLDLQVETGKVFPDIDLDGGLFLRPV